MSQLQDSMFNDSPAIIRSVTASQFAAQKVNPPSIPGLIYNVDGSLYSWNGIEWVGQVTSLTDPVTGGGSFGNFSAALEDNRNTIALIGDSRVANNANVGIVGTCQQGYFTNLNALLGDRFRVVGWFAIGGKQLEDLSGATPNYDVLTYQIPQVLALNPRPKYVFMEAGHNDLYIGSKTSDQVIASWLKVYRALHAAGICLIQSTTLASTGISSARMLSHLARYNRYLLSMNGVLPGFHCFDGHSASVDPANGQMLSARAQVDGLHLNYEGGWATARIGFDFLNPIIPKYPSLSTLPNSFSQLVNNPQGNGTTGSASGSLTASSSMPTDWRGGTSGSAAATLTQVARSDYKTGNVKRLTFSAGSSAADFAYLEGGRPYIANRASSTAFALGNRVRPTVANGRHYLVTVAGTTASGADPTAGWSTALGDQVTDGTVTYTVVESIDVGDTVTFAAEIVAANFNSLPGTCRLSLAFYTSGLGLISQVWGNYADASYTIPSSSGGAQVLRTIPAVIPATTAYIIARLQVIAQNGAVIDVGTLEICKS